MLNHRGMFHAIAFASTGYKGAKDVTPSLEQCHRILDVMAQAAVLAFICPQVISTYIRMAGIVISVMLGKEDYLWGQACNNLIACELDNFSKTVGIGPSSSARAEFMESRSPA